MTVKRCAILTAGLAMLLSTGCSHLTTNAQASLFESDVQSVMTEYSQALSCLGDLIDASDEPAMTVFVDNIKDETVPRRFDKRRLSRGGAWWFHTAIVKMQSDRVTSVVSHASRKKHTNGTHLVLSGAWTQDDLEVGRGQQGIDWRNKGAGYLEALGLSRNREVSVIAGDFLSTVNGKVVHASAISLAVGGSRDGFELRIDDGSRSLDVGVISEVNEGPQFAQRRIAEAAALVHVARAFDIDYRDCVKQDWANPRYYQQQMQAYRSAPVRERHRRFQRALTNAGYNPGGIDGVWGKNSEMALLQFQSKRGIAPTGVPSAQLYGLLLAHSSARP